MKPHTLTRMDMEVASTLMLMGARVRPLHNGGDSPYIYWFQSDSGKKWRIFKSIKRESKVLRDKPFIVNIYYVGSLERQDDHEFKTPNELLAFVQEDVFKYTLV